VGNGLQEVLDALADRIGPQPLVALDRTGRVLWASSRARALLGETALPKPVIEAARRIGSAPRTFSLHFRDGPLEVALQPSGGLVIAAIEQAGPPRRSVTETARRFQLTPAEADVVALAARGLRNRQICLRLGIALPTVKTHLSRAFSKMSVATRVQAALAARRLG